MDLTVNDGWDVIGGICGCGCGRRGGGGDVGCATRKARDGGGESDCILSMGYTVPALKKLPDRRVKCVCVFIDPVQFPDLSS